MSKQLGNEPHQGDNWVLSVKKINLGNKELIF